MRYRFTIRRLLLVTLLVAPLLAVIGTRHRAAQQRKRLARQELLLISALCERLTFAPEQIGDWSLTQSETTMSPRFTRLNLQFRHQILARTINVQLFGGAPQFQQGHGINSRANPFARTTYAGWIPKATRDEQLNIPGIGPITVSCHELFTETLNKTQQSVQLFSHNDIWFAELPTRNQTPCLGVHLRMTPDTDSWSNGMTDPLLLDFAEQFVGELHDSLAGTPPDVRD